MNALLLALVVSSPVSSPYPPHIDYLQAHHAQMLGYSAAANLAIGCLVGGIGSKVNHGSFWGGCGWGAVGGSLVFDGKVAAAGAGEFHGLGAIGKLLGDVGHSIILAAENNQPLDHISTSIGPVGIDVGRHISFYFSGTSVVGFIYAASKGRMDLKESLYNLTPVFVTDSMMDGMYNGLTVSNSVLYYPDLEKKNAISHEMVHVVQNSQVILANNLTWGYWRVGQDLLYGLTSLPGLMTYYNSPCELEAYGLTR